MNVFVFALRTSFDLDVTSTHVFSVSTYPPYYLKLVPLSNVRVPPTGLGCLTPPRLTAFDEQAAQVCGVLSSTQT